MPLYTTERDAISLGDIKYKVQVAAYQHAENYNNTKLNDIGKLEDLNIKGITRFTIGNFRTLQDARDFKKEIIKRGSSDAFITAEVNGERKYLFELTEENIDSYVNGISENNKHEEWLTVKGYNKEGELCAETKLLTYVRNWPRRRKNGN